MFTASLQFQPSAGAAHQPSTGAQQTGGRATGSRVARAALKSSGEIESMREAGWIVRAALDAASRLATAGAKPSMIDSVVAGILAANRAEAIFQGAGSPQGAYPSTCCISVNDAMVHGVPSESPLLEGDIVSIDIGVRLRGWCADGATTVVVGKADARGEELVRTCSECLDLALAMARPGLRWSAIAEAMQSHAASRGFAFATAFVGHGIGRSLHEAPEAPSFVTPTLHTRDDFTLLPGMVLAIEPMLVEFPDPASGRAAPQRLGQASPTVGRNGCALGVATRVDADGWTVRTVSGARSAHFEHTVAIVSQGAEVLTAKAAVIGYSIGERA